MYRYMMAKEPGVSITGVRIKWPDQEAQFKEKLRGCPADDQEVIWSVGSTWIGVDSSTAFQTLVPPLTYWSTFTVITDKQNAHENPVTF